MPGSHSIWAAGGLAVLFTAASVVFLTFLAASLNSTLSLRSLWVGLWVAVAFQAVALVALICETTVFFWRLENVPPRTKRKAWRDFGAAALANTVTIVLPGVMLIIAAVDRQRFPSTIIGLRPIVIIGVAFAVWGLSSLLTIGLLVMLAMATNRLCKSRSVADVGVQTMNRGYVDEKRSRSRPSSSSHDAVTTPQRPWTPISNKAASSLRSASTKIGANSLKTKTGRNSVRSSFESPSATLNEGNIFENAFDHYDTSAIHHEMRSTVLLSSPPSRPALETIPGSRSESQASMTEPQLPSSPLTYNASDPSTPARPSTATSPPSSPPNFSRPTSRHRNQAMSTPPSSVEPMPVSASKAITANLMAALSNPTLPASPTPPPRPRRPSATMNELIHPLFRPSSPEAPPQINTAATMITASPLANKPMTPRTLSRIRSASEIQGRRTSSTSTTGGWKTVPDVSESTTRPRSRSYTSLNSRAANPEPVPSQTESEKKTTTRAPPPSSFPTALKHNTSVTRRSERESESEIFTPDGSELHRSNTKASSIGSPGPSIIEDDVADMHAPILPGFVLSAGSRTSLVGYGKRKSVKRSSAVLL